MNTDTLTKTDMDRVIWCAEHILRESEFGLPRGLKRAAMLEHIDIAIGQIERFPRPYPGASKTLFALKDRRDRYLPKADTSTGE